MQTTRMERISVARKVAPGYVGWLMLVATSVSAHAEDSGDPSALEEIVVNARKRNETLQETPVSVTAFSAVDVSQRGAISIDDLYAAIPNVSTSAGVLQIRGIGYNTRNIGIEAGTTVYVDGAYTGRPVSFNQDLADIKDIEVLRGPQGTLFGKNSIAGVINVTTQKPQFDSFSGHALAAYGNEGINRAQLMLNAPVSENAALRISLDHDGDAGWLRNLFNGREFEKKNNTGGRAAFRWQPSDDLEVTLRGGYYRQHSEPRLNVGGAWETADGTDPQTPPPRVVVAPGPFTTIEDSPTNYTVILRSSSATIQYKVNDELSLTSISGYEDNSSYFAEGEDSSVLNEIEIRFFNKQNQFTQEFRAAGSGGNWNYVAGLFYFHQDSFQENEGILGTDFAIPPLGIPGGIDKVIDPRGSIVTKSYAAYFDVTYRFTPQLEGELGGRVNQEDKSFQFQVKTDAPALFYTVAPGTDKLSSGDFSPTAGLRYHFNDQVMGYARYAKGYKSGGWNADFASTVPGVPAPTVSSLKFAPENAATSELGLKTELFDHRAVLNGAVFYTKFSNLQVAQFNGINLQQAGQQLSVTSNAGKATIKGAELEATWLPLAGLQFSAGAGYQEAVYDRFDNAGGPGISAAGKQFAGVPHWTGNLSGQYSRPLPNDGHIVLRADGSYVGRRYGDVLDTNFRISPAYGVANARLGYVAPQDKWQVFLWSKNLTNHFYIADVTIDQFAIAQDHPVKLVSYGRPATYGLEVQANF